MCPASQCEEAKQALEAEERSRDTCLGAIRELEGAKRSVGGTNNPKEEEMVVQPMVRAASRRVKRSAQQPPAGLERDPPSFSTAAATPAAPAQATPPPSVQEEGRFLQKIHTKLRGSKSEYEFKLNFHKNNYFVLFLDGLEEGESRPSSPIFELAGPKFLSIFCT